MEEDSESKMILNDVKTAEEVNLPEVVAGLKMLAVDKPEEQGGSSTLRIRRSLRARKPINSELTNCNRRCSLRPKKRTFDEMENEDKIKEYYLDKTVKKHTNSLETIFEEREDSSQTSCMSAKRFKRMIQFTTEPTEAKIKKRRARMMKTFGSKRRNVSMQTLLDKLNGLENDISNKTNKLNEIE